MGCIMSDMSFDRISDSVVDLVIDILDSIHAGDAVFCFSCPPEFAQKLDIAIERYSYLHSECSFTWQCIDDWIPAYLDSDEH